MIYKSVEGGGDCGWGTLMDITVMNDTEQVLSMEFAVFEVSPAESSYSTGCQNRYHSTPRSLLIRMVHSSSSLSVRLSVDIFTLLWKLWRVCEGACNPPSRFKKVDTVYSPSSLSSGLL